MLKDIANYVKRNLAPLLVTFICTYALYLRFMTLYRRGLWDDELWQLNQMRGTFFDLLKVLPVNEVSPYLSGDYYLIYPFFKIFSFNKWGLAIPHIIATILGFYLLYLICRKYFKTVWGHLITFLIVCFNATLIWHATEIRVYAVLPTLALASLYLAQILVDNNFQISAGKKIAIGIFFIVLIWFHTYGIIIFLCTLIFAVLNRKEGISMRQLASNLSKFILIILGITMPLWIYSSFISPHYSLKGYGMSVTAFIPGPFADPVGFLKAVLGNLVGSKKLYLLLPGVIFPFILPLRDRRKLILFLTILVVIPIAWIRILDSIVIYHFIQRQFVWVVPLFAFYLGWSWDSFFVYLKRNNKKESST